MLITIVFIPFAAFAVIGLFGRWLGRGGSVIVATGAIFISALFSCIAFYDVAFCKNVYVISLGMWFGMGTVKVEWAFLFDTVVAVMIIIITFISILVHLYSIEYMSNDPHLPKFMSFLSIFTFFMLILVTGQNMVQMFLGWEGVGLSSYLLINFWHTRIQANKSAIKAIIVNRIGDFGLLLAMMVIYHQFHTFNFYSIFALVPSTVAETINFLNFKFFVLDIIAILLFIGAMGKSAQLGLHTWLPDAMEGPTPVSALIHAATMVTAGVFVLVRFSPLLEYAPWARTFITIVGGLTTFFAATVGVFQNDIKRVIAYSTCSQLGYMVFACGMSTYHVSMFHLANHAFFKALLFLSAGSVIHALSDEQDMRKMGGLKNLLPFTYSMFLVGSLSLMGFPFLTGFYSKDLILEVAAGSVTIGGTFVYWLGALSAFFTAFYSIRLLYLVFFDSAKGSRVITERAHEPSIFMTVPLVFLGFGSIFFGYFFKDAFVGLGTDFWNNSIFVLPENSIILESEFIPAYIKLVPVVFSITGAWLSYTLFMGYGNTLFQLSLTKFGLLAYRFFNKKWYFDVVYNYFIVRSMLDFGYFITFKVLDRGFFEYAGPHGFLIIVNRIMYKISGVQSGYIYQYASVMFIGLISFISIIFFVLGNYDFNSDMLVVVIFIVFFYWFIFNLDFHKTKAT